MEIINHEITDFIIPRKLIFNNQIYKITKLDKKFQINGYVVKTVEGKIDMVILRSAHPNALPKTGEFCIPSTLRKHELNENTKKMIKNMLICYNLDDCYFTPWDEIDYEKLEVAGTWAKRE